MKIVLTIASVSTDNVLIHAEPDLVARTPSVTPWATEPFVAVHSNSKAIHLSNVSIVGLLSLAEL